MVCGALSGMAGLLFFEPMGSYFFDFVSEYRVVTSSGIICVVD